MNLLDKLREQSVSNYLSAVDAAFAGSPYAGSNFKGKWRGYDTDGNALVRVNGQTYTAKSLSNHSIPRDTSVILRVARGMRQVNF